MPEPSFESSREKCGNLGGQILGVESNGSKKFHGPPRWLVADPALLYNALGGGWQTVDGAAHPAASNLELFDPKSSRCGLRRRQILFLRKYLKRLAWLGVKINNHCFSRA
jgi:hypothetical protein